MWMSSSPTWFMKNKFTLVQSNDSDVLRIEFIQRGAARASELLIAYADLPWSTLVTYTEHAGETHYVKIKPTDTYEQSMAGAGKIVTDDCTVAIDERQHAARIRRATLAQHMLIHYLETAPLR